MGTDVHIVVHGPVELAEVARDEIERLEGLWSRFLPTSEVSALNRHPGSWVAVTPDTAALVARALEGWEVTRGRFDPTVLGDVVRAGYDRPFDDIASSADRDDAPSSTLHRSATGIELDREAGAVRLPVGVGFDPGGIGKGLAADLVAERLAAEGAAGALVNIGGDLRAVGIGPAGDDWTVDVEPELDGMGPTRLILDHGAVATSSTLRRRWRIGGEARHHLIDPATGRPASSGAVNATVVAAHAWQAEVLAKAALVAGVHDGLAAVRAAGAEALVVERDGHQHTTSGFGRFVLEEVVA